MRLTFAVKGHNSDATNAKLFQYLIPARKINQTKTEQVFETYPEFLDSLAQWFCEPAEINKGYGYPDGTLLIYSFHEDQECKLIARE